MSRTARNLIRLLERERALLRAGRIDEATALAPRKADLADRMERDGAGAEPLEAVRAAATRNMALLDAAREGARAAQEALRAIAGGVTTQTYSAAGACTAIGGDRPRLERRA